MKIILFSILVSFIFQCWCPYALPQQMDAQIMDEMSWPVKVLVLNHRRKLIQTNNNHNRRVGVSAFQLGRRQEPTPGQAATDQEDDNMKIKLFKLMYDAVRDSDVKVKRAELIQGFYANSSTFELGYLLGDIQDKQSVMADIAGTLKRQYNEWKAIEHINAYEQIASRAVEVGHIVELAVQVAANIPDSGETPAPITTTTVSTTTISTTTSSTTTSSTISTVTTASTEPQML